MSLDNLQDAFIRGVYAGELATANQLIQSSERLSPVEQFLIYQGSVTGTLVSAMGDIFPRVKVALGASFFDALSRRYIKQNPSTSWSLDDYGEHLSEFCRDFEPLSDYPYIPDLVRADWAWHQAFHCADVQTIDAGGLQTTLEIHPGKWFELHPSAAFIDSSYPIYQLWHFNERAREGAKDESFELDQSGECLLIWRDELTVKTASLDYIDEYFFKGFKKKQTLEQAFERALNEFDKRDDFEAEQLSKSLSSLINLGLLCEAGNSSRLEQSQ